MDKDLERWRRLDSLPDLEEEEARGDDSSSGSHLLDGALHKRFGALIDGATQRASGFHPGDRVGPYRLLERLGEGGMGAVFLVRRDDGAFEQEAALKVLRRGLGKAGLQRFLQERQILAGLKHPHIARLYDGGVIDDSPYLVMEPVAGLPVTEHCRDHELDLEARLRLIGQACDALRYAHRQGVIHRDIKPSNLLVELGPHGDARLVMLDFGIARLEGTSLEASATGQVFGTPRYMAPEQIFGRRGATDRRSDIFSLGVVLYELAADAHPFPGDDTTEVLERIREGRAVPLKKQVPSLSQDLVTLVETCLATEPGRRYDSVRALADDLDAYLDGRPIHARPVGILGRLWRHARRHPKMAALLATAAGAVAISLIVAATTAVSYTRALETEKRAALEARQEAEDLLDFMLEDLHQGLDRLGRLDLMEEVARGALEHYAKRPNADSETEILGRASALTNVGMVLGSQGDDAAALAAFGVNRDRFQALVEESPEPVWRLELSRAHRLIADVLISKGEVESARQAAEAALGLSHDLASEPPTGWEVDHYENLALLGWILREAGDREGALDGLTAARDFAADRVSASQENEVGRAGWQQNVAIAISHLGLVHFQAGDFDRAFEAFQDAKARCAELVAGDPADTARREEYQLVLSHLGWTHLDSGDAESAATAFRAARREGQTLVDLEPGNVGWLRELAVAHSGLAVALRRGKDFQAALETLEASLEISRTLAVRFPDNPSAVYDLAWDLVETGRLRRDLGDIEAARQAWAEAVERVRAVQLAEDGSPYFLETEAQALLELGRVEEAEPLVRQLLDADWADPDFLKLAAKHGLVPAP